MRKYFRKYLRKSFTDLAAVLAWAGSADHVGRDAPTIGRVAVLVGLNHHGDIMEHRGLVTARGESPPPRHRGKLTGVVIAGGAGQAGRAHTGAEGDRLGEGQDGEVVVQRPGVVARVVGDGGDGGPGEAAVGDAVLSQQDGDGGGAGAGSAVGRGQDVLRGDESPATPGVAGIEEVFLFWIFFLFLKLTCCQQRPAQPARGTR